MDILNNRELAIIIWFSAFILWCCLYKDVRTIMVDIIRGLYVPPILIVFALSSVYVISIVALLHSVELWQPEQLKNTLIWFFAVALFSIGTAIEAKNSTHLIRHLVTNNLKIIVLIEFIIGFYPMSIVSELIMLPIVVGLTILSAFSENKKEYRQTKTRFDYALAVVGFSLILRALYQLKENFNDFAQLSTLADFSLVPLLSLLYLPFIYFLYLFIKYENVVLRLHYFIKDNEVLAYAKPQALKAFHINVNLLNEWAKSLAWQDTKTKENITSSISLYKTLIQRSKAPEDIKIVDGWSPFKATNFLTEHGITTNLYHPTIDDEWFAASEYIKMTDNFRSNIVAYYISGNQQAATKLKLTFHLYDQEDDDETIEWLRKLMLTLLQSAELTQDASFKNEVLSVGTTHTFQYGTVTLREEKYDHLVDEQYIHLEIIHKNHK